MTDATAAGPPGASIFDPGLFVRTAPFMGARNDYDLSACRLAVLGNSLRLGGPSGARRRPHGAGGDP